MHTSTWLAALGVEDVDVALYYVQRQRRNEQGAGALAQRLYTAFQRARDRGERGPSCYVLQNPKPKEKDAKKKEKKKTDSSSSSPDTDDGRVKCPMGSCVACAQQAGFADVPFRTPAEYVRARVARVGGGGGLNQPAH